MPSGILPVATPTHAPHYLIFHFLFAYFILSSRMWKLYYRLDHNVSPRDDTLVHGPKAVAKGRITQAQLDQLRRIENCHANSVEHFPLFATAIVLAHVAGLPNEQINRLGLNYTVARVLYSAAYILNGGSQTLATLRGLVWWSSNVICLRAIWAAGKALNAKL